MCNDLDGLQNRFLFTRIACASSDVVSQMRRLGDDISGSRVQPVAAAAAADDDDDGEDNMTMINSKSFLFK
jgi:hypothetical protein